MTELILNSYWNKPKNIKFLYLFARHKYVPDIWAIPIFEILFYSLFVAIISIIELFGQKSLWFSTVKFTGVHTQLLDYNGLQ